MGLPAGRVRRELGAGLRHPVRHGRTCQPMTTLSRTDDTSEAEYSDKVTALTEAMTRLAFDPYRDIDWDATENVLNEDDPRWQLDPDAAPLAATQWYGEQSLQRRIDMGRWMTANMLKVTLQFEMMLVRGVVHYAGSLPNGAEVFRYLLNELSDECHHIQMFQEFVNRTREDVPGMRRASRIIGPIIAFIGGYANIFLFIGVLCGEQPLHFQQTLQHRGATQVPPLLNRITSIHLAEEARHITFADIHLAQQIGSAGRLRRALYALTFPFFLRWLIGEMLTPPRAFVRQFGIPRQVFKPRTGEVPTHVDCWPNRRPTFGVPPPTSVCARCGRVGSGGCWASTGACPGIAASPIAVRRPRSRRTVEERCGDGVPQRYSWRAWPCWRPRTDCASSPSPPPVRVSGRPTTCCGHDMATWWATSHSSGRGSWSGWWSASP